MIKIAIIGLGIVGSGVVRILEDQKDQIRRRMNSEYEITAIVDKDTTRPREGIDISRYVLTSNIDDVLGNPEIDILIEAMGGEHPAYEFIIRAIKAGKHVVSSNKEVFAKHKTEFFALAKAHNVNVYFEASVCGGIPIIHALEVGYAANAIQSLHGIVNGTTNYILTRMEEENMDYAPALKAAQDKGFAEANPAMDISGQDAAYKLNLLAAVAFKVDIPVSKMAFKGIENITLSDIRYAKEWGYRIKLLACGQRVSADGACFFKVHPTMILHSHPLASVRDEFNAVAITGNYSGPAMLYGKGAGSLPTASAVVSDIIDVALNMASPNKRNLSDVILPLEIIPSSAIQNRFYLRLIVRDTFGVLEKIAGVFGHNQVSIQKLIQKETESGDAELVIVTHIVRESNIQRALQEITALDIVRELCSVIHVGLDNVY